MILALVFSLGLACGDSESKKEIIEEEESLTTEIISETINVKYVVMGYTGIIEKINIETLNLSEYNPRKDLESKDIEYKKINQ